MESKTVFQVTEKLIGEVTPWGDTAIDSQRLANLKIFIEVFDKMHSVLVNVAEYKDSEFYSMKQIGQLAHQSLKDMDAK